MTAAGPPPRERILAAAMRLFGEQGYAATSISRIEEAAGLSPGAGGVYRHFASKQAILEAGIEHAMASSTDLVGLLQDRDALGSLPVEGRLRAVAAAGLRRLDDERDLNRLLLRDLARFPELLARVGREEVARDLDVVAGWLRGQAPAGSADADWEAVAMVLLGAVSHYWILRDTFGEHPSGLSEERFLDAAAALAAAAMGAGTDRKEHG